MSTVDQKNPHHRTLTFMIFACVIFFTLACRLYSAEYWVNRLDGDEQVQEPESVPSDNTNVGGPATNSNFESKCLNSPGTAPCPIDSCVVFEGLYTAKHVVTSELFGKANPSDYQCNAEFQFINNSGVDLMGFEHRVTEYDDNWYFTLYPVENQDELRGSINFFNRKDGQETYSQGVSEIVVLYANPHCDWIEWDEPGLVKYRMPVEAGCFQN